MTDENRLQETETSLYRPLGDIERWVDQLRDELHRQPAVVKRLDDPLDATARAYERGKQQGLERGVDVGMFAVRLTDTALRNAVQEWRQAASERDELASDIEELAKFIIETVPGEPSQPQSAIDTAMRLIGDQRKAIEQYLADLDGLRNAVEYERGRREAAEQLRNDIAAQAGIEIKPLDGTGDFPLAD